MATAQSGIFALGTRTHHHLEYDVTARAANVDNDAAKIALIALAQVSG